jgi:hypothetical protein
MIMQHLEVLAGRDRSGSGYLKLTTFWAYWAVSRKLVLLFRPCGAVEEHWRLVFVGTIGIWALWDRPQPRFSFYGTELVLSRWTLGFSLDPTFSDIVRDREATIFIRC